LGAHSRTSQNKTKKDKHTSKLKTGTKTKKNHSQTISFEDNRLLASLLGEFDSNLALIEERLNIAAVVHGNVITLEGAKEQCDMAQEVLSHLYNRIVKGDDLTPGDVDGALRHTQTLGDDLNRTENKKNLSKNGKQGQQAAENGQAQIRTRKKHITARTPRQSTYIRAIEQSDMVFGIGPAGTGKTYLAVAAAASALERGTVERIILSRPAVEAGERLGFLPGDMRDKVDPYLRPLYDALYDCLPAERVEKEIEAGTIEIAALAFMRGRTLASSFVILDEAQNCTSMQMKMFLTRIGEKSKMVITGDPSQVDLPPGQKSGLAEAVQLLSHVDEVKAIAFQGEDVVRRALVAKIVAAYDKLT